MKNTGQKIDEILDNTTKIKTKIIKEKKQLNENEQKLKTAQAKASAKFKKYGTKLNEHDQKIVNEHLLKINMNQNAHIKRLLFDDINRQKLSFFAKLRRCLFG